MTGYQKQKSGTELFRYHTTEELKNERPIYIYNYVFNYFLDNKLLFSNYFVILNVLLVNWVLNVLKSSLKCG